MPQLEVMLEVPLQISQGLASGQLERVGGVVREVGSKQVVAWLREGGRIADNTELAGGALRTVLNVGTGGAASTATGLLSTAVTARSHFLIMQQMRGLATMARLNLGMGLINLTVASVSLVKLMQRLRELEDTITGLYGEFERDREANLRAGLAASEDAARSAAAGDGDNERIYARQALNRLRAAAALIGDKLKDIRTGGDLDLFASHLTRAMQVDAVMIRCYLDNADSANASQYVADALNKYRIAINEVVHYMLGDQRALYFHETISEDDFWRYIRILHWLGGENRELDRVLIDAIFSDRKNFWNQEIVEPLSAVKRPRFVPDLLQAGVPTAEVLRPRHLWALAVSETLIENYRRLQGIEAEIKAIERLQLTPAAWRTIEKEALATAELNLAEHDDYVFLVDQSYFASQARRSA